MGKQPKEVFLACKTLKRTKQEAAAELRESLRRLRTDHVDLYQFHGLDTPEDLDKVTGPGGAYEAFLKANREGLVRFLGITGHYDPAVLISGINTFDFDTILLALNPADPHFLPFADELLPLAVEKQLGIVAMKIPARGRMFREGGVTTMKDALSYVMTYPVSTTIVGCDNVEQLEENISIAANFEPLSAGEMARIEGLTASYAQDAAFFKKGGAGFGRSGMDDQGFTD